MTLTASAFLDVPVERSLPGFVQVAKSSDLSFEQNEGTLVLTARLGTITVSGVGTRTQLSLASGTPADLQVMQDLLTERLGGMGLALAWDGAPSGNRPANMSLARVESVERISPSYRRVVLSGADLGRFATGGLHFRLLFGPEGADRPTLKDGVTHWPGGIEAWHRPVYTTREIETDGTGWGRIVFDVFLHDGGRTTAWSERVSPGEEIAITGPGGSKMLAPARWVGMVADETAVPVVARMLPLLAPETTGLIKLIVPGPEDIQELAKPKGLSVEWISRTDGGSPLAAVDDLPIPTDEPDCFVFFGGARQDAQAVRKSLAERGLSSQQFRAAAYWG